MHDATQMCKPHLMHCADVVGACHKDAVCTKQVGACTPRKRPGDPVGPLLRMVLRGLPRKRLRTNQIILSIIMTRITKRDVEATLPYNKPPINGKTHLCDGEICPARR